MRRIVKIVIAGVILLVLSSKAAQAPKTQAAQIVNPVFKLSSE